MAGFGSRAAMNGIPPNMSSMNAAALTPLTYRRAPPRTSICLLRLSLFTGASDSSA
jgi:hypothetical protein